MNTILSRLRAAMLCLFRGVYVRELTGEEREQAIALFARRQG